MENISQTAFFRRQSQGNRITEDKNKLTDRLLHLAIQLLCLQTEENYVMLKKYGSKHCSHPQHSDTMEFCCSLVSGREEKILESTKNIIDLLKGEVPIRCQDVTVYFSTEEWEYLEEHMDLYNDVISENQQMFGSMETGKSGNQRAEAVLKCTKELTDLLTGESYILVKTSKIVTDKQDSGYLSRDLKLLDRNNHTMLDTTNKIFKLLAQEVPIRCQDISVHFSMDEWEYLQGHMDIYNDIIMENPQPLISLDGGLPAYKSNGYPCSPRHVEDSNEKIVINSTQSSAISSCIQGSVNRKVPISGPDESVPVIPVNIKSPVYNKAVHCSKKKTFPCSECGRCYTSKYTLRIHLRLHTGVGLYSCPECCKIFASKHLLEVHQRIHTKPFKCTHCHKLFASKITLAVHKQKHIPGAPYYKCLACGHNFETSYDLGDHMKKHPELKSKHTCTECGKYFPYKGNLKAHYRVHTGEKPFSCLECGKAFAYKSHLVSHQRHHTGEGLTCRYCEMFFVDRIRLVQHERVHTGEKPFACLECGRSFSRQYHLLMHQRTHTEVRPFGCTACGMQFTTKKAANRHWEQRRCKN